MAMKKGVISFKDIYKGVGVNDSDEDGVDPLEVDDMEDGQNSEPNLLCQVVVKGGSLGRFVKVGDETLRNRGDQDPMNVWTERRRFTRIHIEVNLKKTLVSKFEIHHQTYRVKYEGLHMICFGCGRFGHRLETCPIMVGDLSSKPQENAAENGGKPCIGEDEEWNFGPWMMAKRRSGKPTERLESKGKQAPSRPTGDHDLNDTSQGGLVLCNMNGRTIYLDPHGLQSPSCMTNVNLPVGPHVSNSHLQHINNLSILPSHSISCDISSSTCVNGSLSEDARDKPPYLHRMEVDVVFDDGTLSVVNDEGFKAHLEASHAHEG
ncbi:unnamed protein product [Lupinus luteus]|uniref:CCHC-type domain-containing protein n=1 Tax=Lupinus luteus TaxID=3873 RepID=A0AAV1XLT8_LUPLU